MHLWLIQLKGIFHYVWNVHSCTQVWITSYRRLDLVPPNLPDCICFWSCARRSSWNTSESCSCKSTGSSVAVLLMRYCQCIKCLLSVVIGSCISGCEALLYLPDRVPLGHGNYDQEKRRPITYPITSHDPPPWVCSSIVVWETFPGEQMRITNSKMRRSIKMLELIVWLIELKI